MSHLYLKTLADLMETQPPTPSISLDPYDNSQSMTENIEMFFRLIRISLQMNNRIGTLVYAYYLGYLLEVRASTPKDRKKYRKVLTRHYTYASIRTYNLFSIQGIQQIYRTQRIEFWSLRLISLPEYRQLLTDALSLV